MPLYAFEGRAPVVHADAFVATPAYAELAQRHRNGIEEVR